jgi:ornithine cyclodeaminase
LLSTTTGEPLAVIDGPALTAWRTAAASALAARYLARPDASNLLILGAGALASYLVRAHGSVRPISRVAIWNRSHQGAERLARLLSKTGLDIEVVSDLERAAAAADIITTATLSRTPLIMGRWISPGTHLDCVGAFKPDMREIDADAIRRAHVWVDTRAGALREGGDLVQAMAEGAFTSDDVRGDLQDLVRGAAPGRTSADEITLFKSVGAAIEDLATAITIYESLN